MAKRMSSWKILGWSALAVVVAVGLWWVWLQWATSIAWEELGLSSERDLAAECALPARRVLLHPATLPGSPWNDYERAVTLATPAAGAARGRSEEYSLLMRYLVSDNSNLRGEVRSVVEGHAKVLDELVRGASRMDLAVPDFRVLVAESSGWESPWKPFVLELAFCDARLAYERGDGQGGGRRMRFILQFARDQACTGLYGGINFYGKAMERLRQQVGHLLTAGRLDDESRGDLERLLEAVDPASPSGEYLVRRSGIAWTHAIHADPPSDGGGAGLRYLYSGRRKGLAEALAYREEMRVALRGSDGWSGADLRGRVVAGQPWTWMPTQVRVAQAQVRVARAALAWARTGEVPPLVDPLGTSILHRLETDGVSIWSVGGNLTDDGGTSKDIVLRIRR